MTSIRNGTTPSSQDVQKRSSYCSEYPKPAYVYQKVPGYCVEKVVTYGHGHSQRHAVECKAGEIKKAEAPVELAPVEPPK